MAQYEKTQLRYGSIVNICSSNVQLFYHSRTIYDVGYTIRQNEIYAGVH
jgi:hypothetical protein